MLKPPDEVAFLFESLQIIYLLIPTTSLIYQLNFIIYYNAKIVITKSINEIILFQWSHNLH